ncbi:MAG: glycosyltransferase family 39 protein [Gemmatimonadota bacterium]
MTFRVRPSEATGTWVALALVTALAAVLRAAGSDRELWWDEVYSLVDSVRRPLGELLTVFRDDNQHPLYAVLAHLSIGFLGETPWTFRLPALLFGVASVPLLFALGASLTSRREALLSATLLAVSYHHVWFSQNARGYTALAFWTLLTTLLLLRLVREPRRRWIAAYAGAAALGTYTHLTMAFVLASHAVVCALLLVAPAWLQSERPRAVLSALALAAAATLALYAPMLGEVRDFFLHRPSTLRGISTPGWALRTALGGLQIGLGTGTGVAAAGVLFACGAASFLAHRRLAFALFVLPGVLTLAGTIGVRGTMYPRYLFFLVGFGILLIVRGAFALPGLFAQRRLAVPSRSPGGAAATVLVALMILVSALSLARNYRYPKQDFGGAVRFVEERRAEGDAVVTAGVVDYPLREVYGRRWPSVESAEQLDELRGRTDRTWLLYTFPRYLEHSSPRLMEAIRRDCPVVRTFRGTVGGGDVVVCAAPAATAERARPRGAALDDGAPRSSRS